MISRSSIQHFRNEVKRNGLRQFQVREHRVNVKVKATVQNSRARLMKAQLLNFSRSGFRILCELPLEVGEQITIISGKHANVGGVVRWAEGLEAGGVFINAGDVEL